MPGSETERSAIDAAHAPWRRRWRSARVVVRDESMSPTLRPGDLLLVDRTAYRRAPPVPGEIAVGHDPEVPGRWLVKRVGAVGLGETVRLVDEDPALPRQIPKGTVFLISDDRRAGRDSRQFGPLPWGRLIGPAWYRLRPRERCGPL